MEKVIFEAELFEKTISQIEVTINDNMDIFINGKQCIRTKHYELLYDLLSENLNPFKEIIYSDPEYILSSQRTEIYKVGKFFLGYYLSMSIPVLNRVGYERDQIQECLIFYIETDINKIIDDFISDDSTYKKGRKFLDGKDDYL